MLDFIRRSLGAQISLKLAVLMLALLALATGLTTWLETRQMEAATLEKATLTAALGARQYGDMFDNAIDSGLLTVTDVFDRKYVEIKGHDWGKHPKYHTRYDSLTDRAVLVFQDRILDDQDFLFAVGVDEKGYLPTHNTVFQKPLEGNEKDLAGNRTKRIFDDPVGKAAAESVASSLRQVYHRDTGETMWDVSAPILVKGRHWGAFRVGVSMVKLDARKWGLALTLTGLLGGFALVITGAMFLVVRQALRPVVALTRTAEQISMGEALDVSVRSAKVDELGLLANAVERLRVSMKAAMSRLGGV
jgi:HAMP domain-containing protein